MVQGGGLDVVFGFETVMARGKREWERPRTGPGRRTRTARAAMGEAATDGIEILFFFNGGRGIGGRGGADGRKPNDEGRKTNC